MHQKNVSTPLPYKSRQRFFLLLVGIFVVVMPFFIFYAMGYRYEFDGTESSIVSIGGMYIASDDEVTTLFIDDIEVDAVRLFRSAAYVQNLSVGMHEVRVDGEGLHTWVKRLPVYSHIVTEAQSFTMPKVPQVRPVTEYVTQDNEAVIFLEPTVGKKQTLIVDHASSTVPIYATTTAATSTYTQNPEYEYVSSLFLRSGTSTSLLTRAREGRESQFRFSSVVPQPSTSTATTTVVSGDARLFEKGSEVYVKWEDNTDFPYYYCLYYTTAASTTERYGLHVYESIREQVENDPTKAESWVCREEIRIDRKWQDVQWFAFLPGSVDAVLMHLEDGLYLVEVDDRAWQNVQPLYLSRDMQVYLDGDRIYIQEGGDSYFELLTEIAET